jgi:RNA polymerase sigma factor (sigma-70 family)
MQSEQSATGMKAVFIEHLPLLKDVIRMVCRRHQLPDDDTADFAASIFLKVIENDYAVLRRLRPGGNLRAFLFTVVSHHLLDRRNHEWGKWRSSARARQLGSAAVHLERLIRRDRLHVQEAVAVLANHPRWALSSQDVRDLHAKLDAPAPRACVVACETLEDRATMPPATPSIEIDEYRMQARSARRTLGRAIRGLSPDDRRLLRLRFEEGRQISEIAAICGIEAKPLYRRFQQLLTHLRSELEQRDLSRQAMRALVGHECVEFGSALPGTLADSRAN